MTTDNLDFLNLNSLRNYPLKEGVTREDTLGVFTIPNDFLVDLELGASYDVSKRYYISKIANLVDVISIEVSDNSDVLVGTFNITTISHNQYDRYYMTPTTAYVGAVGVITVDNLNSILNLPSGSYLFTLATSEVEMRTITPALKGINRLIFINADGETFALTGDVEIEARTNFKFKHGTGNRIILDAGENLGLNTDCEDQLKCIKTINGIPPDSDGNFTLDFSDCASLTPIPANTGLLLDDVCCKPCVGCNDIATLTDRVTLTESTLLELRQYYSSLELLYQEFKTTVTYTCACPPSS